LRSPVLLLGVTLAVPAGTAAQTSPFLPDALYRDLVNEISGDRSFEYVRHLTHYHRTGPGRDFWAAADYLRSAAAAAGLEDVRLIRQPWSGHPWSCRSGETWLLGPEPVKIADYGEVAVSIADHSRTTHVRAPLVDVGNGTVATDYEGREVRGRIVLAAGDPAAVLPEAVWKRGALGVLSYATRRPEDLDAPDQVAWARIPYESRGVEGVPDGIPGTFAVMVSPRRGRSIRRQLASTAAPVEAKVDIETEEEGPREQGMVEAWIRGSEIHDRQVVLTAHIQEEMTSANDDGSGCANVLEIGRAIARLVAQGKIPRPRRDLRFWWVNELSSEPQYFHDHPGESRRMLVSINQDMVGARQSWGGRVQYASRLPWSEPHPLEDVTESILEAVRDGNTSYLANRGTGKPQPFLREITAVKGSREPYHAALVPYYDSTDHHSFNESDVGVPATSFTNWPDEYIQSTGDDLENVDATQLERNAVVVAAIALYFASLREDDVPGLAAYVSARGLARVARDTATAIAHVTQAPPEKRPPAEAEARNLVRQAHLREERELDSFGRLGGGSRTRAIVDDARMRLERSVTADLELLDAAVAGITGGPLRPGPAVEDRVLASTVYAVPAGLADLHERREKVKVPAGLHRMMAFETLNFADGTRTGWEIYEAVAAEALSAGEWYYGRVTPADVRAVLDGAVESGALVAMPRKEPGRPR
jgi:hypothetical protein